MSTIGITTNLLTPIEGLPSAANEFVTDLNHLAQDLKSGDLAAAAEDYVLFSEDLLNAGQSVPVPVSVIAVGSDGSGLVSGAPVQVAPIEQTSQGAALKPVAASPGSESSAPSLSLQA